MTIGEAARALVRIAATATPGTAVDGFVPDDDESGILIDDGDLVTIREVAAVLLRHVCNPELRGIRRSTLADVERAIIEDRIESFGGRYRPAAKSLGINAATVYRKRIAWAEADRIRFAPAKPKGDAE